MNTEHIVLKEAPLHNNCPECYANDGLILTFTQQKTTSKFMTLHSKEAVGNLKCTKCGSNIFMGRWTDEIEQVYKYHQKTIVLPTTGKKFTQLFYGLVIGGLCILVGGGILCYIYMQSIPAT